MTRPQSNARLAVTIAAACSVAVSAVITGIPAYSQDRASPGRRAARAGRPRPRRRLPRRAGHVPGRPGTQPRLHRRASATSRRAPGCRSTARSGSAATARRSSRSRCCSWSTRARSTSTHPSRPTCPGCVHGDGVGRAADHRPAGPPAHQRGAQLHRGDGPGLLRDAAPLRRAARAARPRADAAGHAAGVGVVVQQHQLRDRRADRAEGHRPAARRGGHRPGHRAAAPAGHLRARPRRGGAPRATPARVPRVGARRRAAGHHGARPVVGLGGGRHRVDPERSRRVLRRAARRRAAARPSSSPRCRRPSRRRRSCTACGTGWRSSAPR